MRFGSVCSGIEAASVAWNPLGWRAAWLSEIEPFPAAVLAHHYPDVPNLGDMTTLPARIASGEVDAPDVFCGGTPCQAFSVAGLRKSLDDARGNLSLTFCEIANEIDAARSIRGEQPAIVFWENVPGVLNTKDNAFGCLLAGLAGEDDPLVAPGGKWTNAGCVFGPKRTVAWRVLDAQYFGVAQRRRRVFVVASARDGFDPAKVLFEFDGVRRDIAPSREARKGATASSTSRAGVGSQQQHYACGIPGNWIGRKPENGGNAVEPMHNVAPCLTSADRHGVAVGTDCYNGSLTGDVACTMGTPGSSVNASGPTVMVPIGFHPGNLARGSGPSPSGEVFGTLISSHGRGSTDQFPHVAIPLAFPENLSGTQCASTENISPALGAANPTAVACKPMAVRRLLPIECEKLQGFPEVKKNVKIRACLDHQNPSASAETQCLKLPNNARSAEPGASPPSASVAGQSSSTSPPIQSGRVAVNVQIDLERMHLHLHSAGRLLLSVSLAEPQSRYPLLTQLGNIAPLLVQVLANLERTTTAGRAASHPHTNTSLHQLNGSPFVELSGQEIGEFANDAETFTKKASAFTKFITSQAGQSFLSCSETLRTLCCFATAAISLCIQEKTNWASSYEISIDLVQGYTAIPWRKKPASDCPDGPRYKALGNSWAVPVVRWIGQRISDELARIQAERPAANDPQVNRHALF